MRYRKHAEELRGAAAQARNVSIRAKLLVNIRDYERMASSLMRSTMSAARSGND